MAFKSRGELQGGQFPMLSFEGDDAQSEALAPGRWAIMSVIKQVPEDR